MLLLQSIFKVNIEPPTETPPSGYKRLSPLGDPLPIVEERRIKKDFNAILAEAKTNGKPISPVRRIRPLNVDVDECPICGAPAAYLYSLVKDLKAIKSSNARSPILSLRKNKF